MASELELAGLLSQVDDDAGDEEIFAAQWQHESDNEPLAAAVYLMSNADPQAVVEGGSWGWQWVGAVVVAVVSGRGEEVEVEAVVAGKQVDAGAGKRTVGKGAPVNWTWCCCYLHAALSLSTGAAGVVHICAERGGGRTPRPCT